jgi:hypothetical protein
MEVGAGMHIMDAAREAIALSKKIGQRVGFEFNGTFVTAAEDDDVNAVIARWGKVRAEEQKKREEEKRFEEERREDALIEVVITSIEKMFSHDYSNEPWHNGSLNRRRDLKVELLNFIHQLKRRKP